MNAAIEQQPASGAVEVMPDRQPSSALAISTPFELLRMVVANNAPLETIEKFMDLNRRFEADQARKAFVAAMSAFKREPMEILKNKSVGYTTKDGDFVGYKHADLADVVDVVVPNMGKHGLSHRWDVTQKDGMITVDCVITHELGHSETVTMFAPPDDSGKKNAIQKIASTVTYLQRYTLLAACGLAAKDIDDDGQGGAAGYEDQPTQSQRQPTVEPKPPCPDRVMQRNHDTWAEALGAKTTTAAAIIATVETKYTLSEDQKKTIRALAKNTENAQ
jgi:hypothetical protein